MLTFYRYHDGDRMPDPIPIDPCEVLTVIECSRSIEYRYMPSASILTLVDGTQHLVHDPDQVAYSLVSLARARVSQQTIADQQERIATLADELQESRELVARYEVLLCREKS